jgi:hypothetical protein
LNAELESDSLISDAFVHDQSIPRTQAILFVGGEPEAFGQQRLKHRRNPIAGGAFRYLGEDLEAILIQPGRSDDLVHLHLEGSHKNRFERGRP